MRTRAGEGEWVDGAESDDSDASACDYVAAGSKIPADLDTPLRNLSQVDIFDDLAARFLLNIPEQDLCSLIRVGFHIQQAFWYYVDFYRGDLYPELGKVRSSVLN